MNTIHEHYTNRTQNIQNTRNTRSINPTWSSTRTSERGFNSSTMDEASWWVVCVVEIATWWRFNCCSSSSYFTLTFHPGFVAISSILFSHPFIRLCCLSSLFYSTCASRVFHVRSTYIWSFSSTDRFHSSHASFLFHSSFSSLFALISRLDFISQYSSLGLNSSNSNF